MRVKEPAQEKLKHNDLFNFNSHDAFGSSLDYTELFVYLAWYLTTHVELRLWQFTLFIIFLLKRPKAEKNTHYKISFSECEIYF